MKRALVEADGRIAQLVEPGSEFPVHDSLRWVDVPDDTRVGFDTWVSGAVVKAATSI